MSNKMCEKTVQTHALEHQETTFEFVCDTESSVYQEVRDLVLDDLTQCSMHF